MSLEDIEGAGARHIEGLRATVHEFWVKACEHDGIPPSSSFVVFSENNPYVSFHDNARRQLMEAQAAFVPGGGYVGLCIEKGRATTKRERGEPRQRS